MSGGDKASKDKRQAIAALLLSACAIGPAVAATSEGDASSLARTQVQRLLQQSDEALKGGNPKVAEIQLRNAVRLAPHDWEIRVKLGGILLQNGNPAEAERELRQASVNFAPEDMVTPTLLKAMLRRKEMKELLAEFSEPTLQVDDKTAPDILLARAIALQFLGEPKQARTTMNRSLRVRRDAPALIASAKLARDQGDIKLAADQAKEAVQLGPADEEILRLNVLLTRQTVGLETALKSAEEFLQQFPKNEVARALAIELLLEAKQDARAKQEVSALLKQSPKSQYGRYFRALEMAREKDFKTAWTQVQSLSPDFVASQPSVGLMVSNIALSSGNAETASGILRALIVRYPDLREPRLQLAAVRLAANDPEGAVEGLAPLKANKDPEVHALLAQGYTLLRQYDLAIASLEIANSSPATNDLLEQQLALSQLVLGKSDQAIQALRELDQRDPGNPAYAVPLIFALSRASKWDEALSVADKMAKAAPSSPLPPFYKGKILASRGDLSLAETEFRKALALDPKFAPALYYRANLSLSRGQPESAKEDLELLLVQNPANLEALLKLANIEADYDQYEGAQALLNRAVKAAPRERAPRLALSKFEISRGKVLDAQATVDALLDVLKDDPEALALKSQIDLLLGKITDAVAILGRLTSINPSSSNGYAMLSKALLSSHDQVGAETAARKAIELDPTSTQIRMNLIDIQIDEGFRDAALATARAYSASNPGIAADILVANTFIRLNRLKDAEFLLEQKSASRPDASIALLLSQVAALSGNPKKAIAVLAGWMAKHPSDFGMRREHAAALMQAGDTVNARKEYEDLLKQHPNDAVILNNLGLLLQKTDADRAFELISRAQKIAPRIPEIADSLGWMKFQRQDQVGALALLQHAYTVDARSPTISYHFARALDANGKRTEAKQLLQTALAKNPGFDELSEAKEVLAGWQ